MDVGACFVVGGGRRILIDIYRERNGIYIYRTYFGFYLGCSQTTQVGFFMDLMVF